MTQVYDCDLFDKMDRKRSGCIHRHKPEWVNGKLFTCPDCGRVWKAEAKGPAYTKLRPGKWWHWPAEE